MIPRSLERLARARQQFSWAQLCDRLLPYATVMRWKTRASCGQALLEKAGPKKREPLDAAAVKEKIEQLNHGRQRTAGTCALYAQLSTGISRRHFQELVAEVRQNKMDAMERIRWLVPGTAWSLDTTEYGPEKMKITPLRDLASRYQLPTPWVGAHEQGEQIALYLEGMFKREGAPMFLKRDWGSPLNCRQVDAVLERHGVLPLNSPPGYPQYNGSMERSMRDLQDALDQRQWDALQLPMSLELELVTHQLNHRRLRGLGHRTPCQVYHDPAHRVRLHGASRQRIFREVFQEFWQYVPAMPDRSPHHLVAAWRLVVKSWLRRQGWISVKEKHQTKVSTNSNAFFSHN
jgi:transposase InsO family protein